METSSILYIGFAIVGLAIVVSALRGRSVDEARIRRLSVVKDRHAASTEAVVAARMRRAINTTEKNTGFAVFSKYVPRRAQMSFRLRRTGKKWTINQYTIASLVIFGLAVISLLVIGAPFLFACMFGLLIGLGLPHMIVSMLISSRVKKFNLRFADSIDLLVRGIKSGLPVTETFQLVGKEMPGPTGEEFRAVSERIRIGKTIEAALQETADLLGTAEFQFLCITISIQRETGGNLAETMANLSNVLRSRSQMKLKIKAMSSEAKASAYIVGVLPFFVFGIVWVMNPGYLAGFFSETRLMIAGGGGLIWMGIGAAMMAKMISFKI